MKVARIVALGLFLVACLVLVVWASDSHAQEVPQCPGNVPAQGCYVLGGGSDTTVTRPVDGGSVQYPPSAEPGIDVAVSAQPHFTG